MGLTKQWRSRLDRWIAELERNIYRPLGDIDFEGFVTFDQLSPRQAAAGEFEPYPVGRKWGQRWEYGWFRGAVEIPAELAGKRVVIQPKMTNREGLVWCNGKMIESWRPVWPYITLSESAAAGEKFELLIEAYAWHYQEHCGIGPVSDWRDVGPEAVDFQQCIEKSSFGVWDEEAFALFMDVKTLLGIRDAHDSHSLRVAKIDESLREFTLTVDFQQDAAGRAADYKKARKLLKPALDAVNGSVAPEFYAFGHAHLDVAWLWPLGESRRKAARTLANQLAMIERYEGYKFMHSQPQLFEMISEDYPDLFERVKRAVANGSIIADGAAWVEPDTNISGGEALIRQMLIGKKYIRENFGLDSRHLWLPDVFGYSGALPQILRGCGVETFSTQKIFWNYQSEDTFPYHNFIWEGIDGSEIVVHLHHDYNSQTDPQTLATRWKSRVQSDGMSMRMLPFGWGDGGGGPEPRHLEYIKRLADCQGCPKVSYASPQEFFDELTARGEHEYNRWVGELYFASHRGVLTSQAKTKLGNRRSEQLLREAEMWLATAAIMSGGEYPAAELEKNWKLVLLNQFHDILPGSSINRVYQEAEAHYQQVTSAAAAMASDAAGKLTASASDAMTLFNSLSWSRSELVELPDGCVAASDGEGSALGVQQIDGKNYAEITLPACGWASVTLGDKAAAAGEEAAVKAQKDLLENDLISVRFNELGEIVSMIDKATGREQLPGGGNILRMFRDEPANYDAWDIDSMYEQSPVDMGSHVEIKVIAGGPLAGVLELKRKFSKSSLTQRITLRRGSRRVDFATTVDWQESHRLLRVYFAPLLRCENAIHEVQFGHILRPTHTNRVPDQDRFEVCNHRYTAMADGAAGFAVLNDCKYGASNRNGEIGLSLLRAPLGPDESADKGTQVFTYAAMAFTGSFADSDVTRQGYQLNHKPLAIEGAAGSGSLLSVAGAGVIVEAVKLAEDGSGDLIVRLYESRNTSCSAMVNFNIDIDRVERTNMLETDGVELPSGTSNDVLVELRPFEIVTLRVHRK